MIYVEYCEWGYWVEDRNVAFEVNKLIEAASDPSIANEYVNFSSLNVIDALQTAIDEGRAAQADFEFSIGA